ncbi:MULTISPECIES: hypothetical protein [Paraburkholderia]|uniref:Uncharacterized protein n=1 Tax=Paraburkholderia dioscoreae TaxID=2604047 RepID=A0A5Q4ZDZ8_9BURK|nr:MULTISPECIES: hypothetical protein [Paraburkholderia]MDR8397034.1 hypothetical protein [Paraburkholderia sp. USG1]VVD27596.1 protein of unknown function [Paraburkholderia dioscoreae]
MDVDADSPLQHTVTPTGVLMLTRARDTGRSIARAPVLIDFDELGIARGGLLETALLATECPIGRATLNCLRRVLNLAPLPLKLTQLLGTKIHELGSADILEIFGLIEDVLARRNTKSLYTDSVNARSILKNCNLPLKDNRYISNFKFSSRFPIPPRGVISLWSEFHVPDSTDADLRTPISQQDFNSIEERNKNAYKKIEKTKALLISKCKETLDAHESLVRLLLETKYRNAPALDKRSKKSLERGNIPCMKKEVYEKMTEEDRLWIICDAIERFQIYNNLTARTLRLSGITALYPLVATTKSSHELLAAALSDYYLPRLAVTACSILLTLESTWNADTLYSLTRADIQTTKSGFHLTGLKGRGNQPQDFKLEQDDSLEAELEILARESEDVEITDSEAVRALKLLLANQERIKIFTEIEKAHLFSSLRLGKHSESIFVYAVQDTAILEFCKHHNLPRLSLKDIRTIGAHAAYLRPNGGIHLANALLRHRSLATTSDYLRSSIINALCDANILRFMKKLQASILFSCGREDILISKNISNDFIDKDLLFPISPFQSEGEQSLIDKWLDASGEMKLEIGVIEIHHCAAQYAFYRDNFGELSTASPERFIKRHLPRIVTCVALRNVIRGSTHSALLMQLEEKYREPWPFVANPLNG